MVLMWRIDDSKWEKYNSKSTRRTITHDKSATTRQKYEKYNKKLITRNKTFRKKNKTLEKEMAANTSWDKIRLNII